MREEINNIHAGYATSRSPKVPLRVGCRFCQLLTSLATFDGEIDDWACLDKSSRSSMSSHARFACRIDADCSPNAQTKSGSIFSPRSCLACATSGRSVLCLNHRDLRGKAGERSGVEYSRHPFAAYGDPQSS